MDAIKKKMTSLAAETAQVRIIQKQTKSVLDKVEH